jgi:hypothetical protein
VSSAEMKTKNMKGNKMSNKDILIRIEKEYKEKVDRRMKQMVGYWEKNPHPVKIVLSEESRNYLKTVCTGKQRGTEWNKLDIKIKNTHTKMVSDATHILTIKEPKAFHPEQVTYYKNLYKNMQNA